MRGESKATVQSAEAFAAIEVGLAELQRDYDARLGRWERALERLTQQMNDEH
ncbi:MAG: hypothetical protein NTW87_17235 [Planctomycetota bacterium]|nr:hypothetical protein [Planctomycetota bacterium]